MSCKNVERAYDRSPMALQRQGLAQRVIALLIAAAMPLCCCVINAGSSCCTSADQTPVVEVASCCVGQHCQPAQTETTNDHVPCSDGDCNCCLKAPAQSTDWAPPVDTIGSDIPAFALDTQSASGITGTWASNAWDDPPPKPGGADAIRGVVILQV